MTLAAVRLAQLFAIALLAAACTPDSELSDAQLYRKYCAECHGEDGAGDESLRQGNEKVDLLSSQRIRDADRAFVHRRVAYGYGQMPAYLHKLDPPDLERLVHFVMQIQEPNQPPRKGDADGSPTLEGRLPAPGGSG